MKSLSEFHNVRQKELEEASIKLNELSQKAEIFWSVKDHLDLKKIIQILEVISEL